MFQLHERLPGKTGQAPSVGLICDSGLKVVFADDHAMVTDPKGVELCRFERKQGLYLATVKLKNPLYKGPPGKPDEGFHRQGR